MCPTYVKTGIGFLSGSDETGAANLIDNLFVEFLESSESLGGEKIDEDCFDDFECSCLAVSVLTCGHEVSSVLIGFQLFVD